MTNIKKEEHFILNLDSGNKNYENYIDVFKLRGRYNFHKKDVKKVIYGRELFEGEIEDLPLTKLKRDIAKGIGIIEKI